MISIIMPLHNGSNFLDDSINSILNQTFKQWELLIGINGHQGDSALKIIKKIKSFGSNRIKITLYNKKSKSRTLNKLAMIAKYNYICMIDVDDIWLPTKLEKQLPLMEKYDVVGTNVEYFGDKTGNPGLFLGKLSFPMFVWQNPIVNSSVMMKKENAVWDNKWEGLDDYNTWVELLKKNRVFYNIPEVLTMHRLHENSYYNHKNHDIAQKLIREKLPKLTSHEMDQLSDIMDHKKWEL